MIFKVCSSTFLLMRTSMFVFSSNSLGSSLIIEYSIPSGNSEPPHEVNIMAIIINSMFFIDFVF